MVRGTEPGNAVDALMDQLIDYAGLFPPSSHDMAVATQEYLGWVHGPHGRLVRAFQVPVTRLDALAEQLPDTASAVPLGLIVNPGAEATWSVGVTQALGAAAQWVNDGRLRVRTVEVRLPGSDELGAREAVTTVVDRVLDAGLGDTTVFVEVPVRGASPAAVQASVDGVAEVAAVGACRVGTKIRCGGVTPDAFPSAHEIASFLAASSARRLPVKSTAGLHRAMPYHDPATSCDHHGFLGVVIGALLLHAGTATTDDVVQMVAERDRSHFRVDADELGWSDLAIPSAAVVEGRSEFFTSYGSCSVAEPLADLTDMGLVR